MLGRDGDMPSGGIIRHMVPCEAGAAAELAASLKEEKYASIGSEYPSPVWEKSLLHKAMTEMEPFCS